MSELVCSAWGNKSRIDNQMDSWFQANGQIPSWDWPLAGMDWWRDIKLMNSVACYNVAPPKFSKYNTNKCDVGTLNNESFCIEKNVFW